VQEESQRWSQSQNRQITIGERKSGYKETETKDRARNDDVDDCRKMQLVMLWRRREGVVQQARCRSDNGMHSLRKPFTMYKIVDFFVVLVALDPSLSLGMFPDFRAKEMTMIYRVSKTPFFFPSSA